MHEIYFKIDFFAIFRKLQKKLQGWREFPNNHFWTQQQPLFFWQQPLLNSTTTTFFSTTTTFEVNNNHFFFDNNHFWTEQPRQVFIVSEHDFGKKMFKKCSSLKITTKMRFCRTIFLRSSFDAFLAKVFDFLKNFQKFQFFRENFLSKHFY